MEGLLNKNRNGFTLLEIIVVLGVLALIFFMTIPVSVKFYKGQIFSETVDGLLGTLRQAQSQSISQKSGDNFGVKIINNSYVLFEGASYNERNISNDRIFLMDSSISSGGLNEVVFSGVTGKPNVAGTITLSSDSRTKTIEINGQGGINKQ